MLCVKPSPIEGEFPAPPSKPMSQRYIFASALAEGATEIGPLELSDDVVAALRAIQPISSIELRGDLAVIERRTPDRYRAFSVGDSGFTGRVATALYAGIEGFTAIFMAEQLSRRPLRDLVDVLSSYARIVWLPGVVLIDSSGVRRVDVKIRGDVTSQYISGLMFLSTVAEEGGRIEVTGERKSWQYVEATGDVIRIFGGQAEVEDNVIYVRGPLKSPGRLAVPGDYSLSAFLMVGAAITGGRARITNLRGGPDEQIVDILQDAGVSVVLSDGAVSVEGQPARPLDVDLSTAPDLAPPVALLGAFTAGASKIRGVQHLAYKESNRIESISDIVRRLGARAEYSNGVLTVEGPPRRRDVAFECHGDHRICLMALTAMRAVGGCVNDLAPLAKTWPSAVLYLLQSKP
ncbi:3-phosphoshikimate 1-carboxyvinyltransferase [Thermoproteus tenax]|uniref:3-phosphoshikimate 1-carboxyvinyltransferase n=1 Tax=Thermoproteus tenax (strain ATCC 35583 / DSM 2078 / JCM 9277 / NBRC 100435 / Kra 1) TaxID=768679 RepID=G4RLC7_THETK|nr:3-phosphoshikimate 1-carboxyvinyltransferase [Thermoproteus tenax]CCC82372.1 3-phosphoshikimate 1-carboxyvinyltransferase [Thermoproteus tenax Kra 1]